MLDIFLTRMKRISSQEGSCPLKVITFVCYKFGLVHPLVGFRTLKTARIFVYSFYLKRMYNSRKSLEFKVRFDTVPRLAGNYS
jgi:hypothetical protein